MRDVQKMDPGRAFGMISKILFIKMYVERSGLHGTFTTEFLDLRKKASLKNEISIHNGLFESTKDYYKADELLRSSGQGVLPAPAWFFNAENVRKPDVEVPELTKGNCRTPLNLNLRLAR